MIKQNNSTTSTPFAIGEIVRIVEGIHKGFICIVEEIVIHPSRHPMGGIYSLYGWGQPNPTHIFRDKDTFGHFPDHPSDWYFGDFAGNDLRSLGRIASIEELEEYRKAKNFDKLNEDGEPSGFSKDLDFMIANIGKRVEIRRKSIFD